MSDVVDAYASALYTAAAADGALERIEDELFRIARTFETSDELRQSLTDPHVPAEKRQGIVEQLLGGKADDHSVALVSYIVGVGRARDLPAIIDKLVAQAASERNKEVAEVRTTVELSDEQQTRLADALSKRLGKSIELKTIIDPSIKGGIHVQVGDTVIDGSVRHRLELLKERI